MSVYYKYMITVDTIATNIWKTLIMHCSNKNKYEYVFYIVPNPVEQYILSQEWNTFIRLVDGVHIEWTINKVPFYWYLKIRLSHREPHESNIFAIKHYNILKAQHDMERAEEELALKKIKEQEQKKLLIEQKRLAEEQKKLAEKKREEEEFKKLSKEEKLNYLLKEVKANLLKIIDEYQLKNELVSSISIIKDQKIVYEMWKDDIMLIFPRIRDMRVEGAELIIEWRSKYDDYEIEPSISEQALNRYKSTIHYDYSDTKN